MKSAIVYASQSRVYSVEAMPEIIAEEYFDFAGRNVDAGTKGLLVKRTTSADGTIRAEKLMVR